MGTSTTGCDELFLCGEVHFFVIHEERICGLSVKIWEGGNDKQIPDQSGLHIGSF